MNIVLSEGSIWWSYGGEEQCHVCASTRDPNYWCGKGCRGLLCAKCVNTPGQRCTRCEEETAEGP